MAKFTLRRARYPSHPHSGHCCSSIHPSTHALFWISPVFTSYSEAGPSLMLAGLTLTALMFSSAYPSRTYPALSHTSTPPSLSPLALILTPSAWLISTPPAPTDPSFPAISYASPYVTMTVFVCESLSLPVFVCLSHPVKLSACLCLPEYVSVCVLHPSPPFPSCYQIPSITMIKTPSPFLRQSRTTHPDVSLNLSPGYDKAC